MGEIIIMKKITRAKVLISKLTFAGVLAASSVSAFADANLNVSADIPVVCNFSSTDYALDFGLLDPASSANAIASVDVAYWCTAGALATLQADMGLNENAGSRRLDRQGTYFIPYSLTLPAGGVATNGPGTPVTATISGTILNADYINNHWGAYSDVVLLSLIAE